MIEKAIDFISLPVAGYIAVLAVLAVTASGLFILKRFVSAGKGKLLRTVGYAIYVSLLFWVVFEGYFRFIYRDSDGISALKTHEMWIERNVRQNDLNFRDDIDYRPLLNRDNNVFLVGDSLQWGQGIAFEDTITAVLRKRFPQYNFLNLSFPGWSTSTQAAYYATFSYMGYHPEILILNYFLNDIDDFERLTVESVDPGKKRMIKTLRFCYSCQLMYSKLVSYRDRALNSYFELLVNAYESDKFDVHKKQLLKFISQAESDGAEVFVVIWYALPVQANQRINSVGSQIKGIMEEAGVDYIDPYAELSGLDVDAQIASRNDHHPSGLVHGIIANMVSERIESMNRK